MRAFDCTTKTVPQSKWYLIVLLYQFNIFETLGNISLYGPLNRQITYIYLYCCDPYYVSFTIPMMSFLKRLFKTFKFRKRIYGRR